MTTGTCKALPVSDWEIHSCAHQNSKGSQETTRTATAQLVTKSRGGVCAGPRLYKHAGSHFGVTTSRPKRILSLIHTTACHEAHNKPPTLSADVHYSSCCVSIIPTLLSMLRQLPRAGRAALAAAYVISITAHASAWFISYQLTRGRPGPTRTTSKPWQPWTKRVSSTSASPSLTAALTYQGPLNCSLCTRRSCLFSLVIFFDCWVRAAHRRRKK